MSYPVVQRLRIGDVLTAMASVGAPGVSPVPPLAGGAVGAWEVARSSGASSVLTWRSSREGHDRTAEVQRVAELVEIARTAGVPAPRYEDIIPLADGSVVVLQEFVEGVRPTAAPGVIASLLDLSDRRRDLLSGPSYQLEGTPLYLTEDGPGFCLHGPLRDHNERTRRLLDWIETVGRSEPEVVGADVVHFDYHLGNVLVAPDDPGVVVAIVDWDDRVGDLVGWGHVLDHGRADRRSDRLLPQVLQASLREAKPFPQAQPIGSQRAAFRRRTYRRTAARCSHVDSFTDASLQAGECSDFNGDRQPVVRGFRAPLVQGGAAPDRALSVPLTGLVSMVEYMASLFGGAPWVVRCVASAVAGSG